MVSLLNRLDTVVQVVRLQLLGPVKPQRQDKKGQDREQWHQQVGFAVIKAEHGQRIYHSRLLLLVEVYKSDLEWANNMIIF